MSNIPGLSLCPANNEGDGIQFETISGTGVIPESHRLGNCRSVNDFEKLATIAEGSFGTIYKCRDRRTDGIYALKKYKMPSDMDDGIPSSILREINILCSLKHINIISSHGTIAGRNLESNYLLLDYYSFSLYDLMEKDVSSIYERHVVKGIMKQLLHGLEFIHEGLIIHRDINCRNLIFTEDGILKITGFCSARFHSKGNMTPGVTELEYRAPELLFKTRLYGPAVDMWSAGCVFGRLLLKRVLFPGNSELEVLSSIVNVLGTPSENIWPGFSELYPYMDGSRRVVSNGPPYSDLNVVFREQPITAKELIQGLLIYYPQGRSSANFCLNSPYFKEAPRESSTEHLASILKNVNTPKPVIKKEN